jgi:hypothetical protein
MSTQDLSNGPRILIVEDEAAIAMDLRGSLRREWILGLRNYLFLLSSIRFN